MESVKLTCGVCENACDMKVEVDEDEVVDVEGNRCMRGFAYAQREIINMHKK